MNHKSANRHSQQDLPRCQYHSHSGRRCRFPVSDARSPHCPRHASRLAPTSRGLAQPRSAAPPSPDTALSAVLPADPAAFKSASQINDFLSALLVHLAQNRISARRAAVLAYITNQLLRTLPAIEKELDALSPEGASGPTVVVDLPRPVRSESNQPS
ncbi:MAG: hypothetical protein LAN84_16055 [Acidobacteriia bacterium]|nr:hypothetical protein [Terriglobia bacterium]